MARQWYQIPTSLAQSFLDHELAVAKSGPLARPTPMKQLLFMGGGLLVLLFLVTKTFIATAGPVAIILFSIWWLALVFYLGGMTKTRELRVMTLPALLAYVPKRAREVLTRRSSDPSDFNAIANISGISADGRIYFGDGGQGQLYLVVGSASYLLFDEDRIHILDQADAFWRMIDPGPEWVTITTREPQRIFHQIASLEDRNQALEVRDPDLIELQNEQYDILTKHVGGNYSSIHQYLLLRAGSEDELRKAHRSLQAEVEGGSSVIKEATMLDRSDALAVLRVFYRGVDDEITALHAAKSDSPQPAQPVQTV